MSNSRLMRIPLSYENLSSFAFILFFAQDAVRTVVERIFFFLSSTAVTWLMIFLMYLPLLLLVCYFSRRASKPVCAFLILLLAVAAFFFGTYLLHPEYETWYFGDRYPIGNWIFRPDRFLYAFLFVCVMPDPKTMIRALKIVAVLLLLFYTYRLINALRVGYWITTTTASGPQRVAYNLSYGYDQLFVFAVFCASGFREKRAGYFILAGVSFVEILLGGSRAPLLYIVLMLLLLYLRYRKTLSVKLRLFVILVAAVLVAFWAFLGVNGMLILVGRLMSKVLGRSSRTLQTLLGGVEQMTDSSGRDRLYGIAWDMVKNGFWGYGAYGDRYVIGRTFWVGYTHNLFLELLIDCGWIVGGYFCLRVVYGSAKMLITCRDEYWYTLFIIFFTGSLKLLTSGSFWFSDSFWGVLAVCYLYRRAMKQQNDAQLETSRRTDRLKTRESY